tara:strand:- start:167 stop:985 length:819 start_codon:yes stop_codon:yes gene_type:complete
MKKYLFVLIFFVFNFSLSQVILEKIILSKTIFETSGLEYFDNGLVTHNDSGNNSALFYFNFDGEITHIRSFENIKNNDWEDLTTDDKYIYIADIGNNFDTRDDLRIIKAPLDISDNNLEIINFYYPEQVDFSFKQLSMYDAEALISIDDNLFIFTKNRARKITEIYKLPKKSGNYKAELIGKIDIESIVTAADYNEKMKLLVLTSTKDFNEYYIHKIKNFQISKLKNFKTDTYKIPIGKTQVESIKIIDKNNFWITSEAELMGSPFLYKISL